jgi:hypothetical protein
MSGASVESVNQKLLYQAEELAKLTTDYEWIKKAISAIEGYAKEVAESQKAMVRLEMEGNENRAALTRAFRSIDREEAERVNADLVLANKLDAGFIAIGAQLKTIENEMPTLKLARTCVFAVIAVALGNMSALVYMVLKMKGVL